MPQYEIREFIRELDVEEGGAVIAASISAQGSRLATPNATNFALVRLPDGDSEEDTEGVTCGYNGCGRTVSDPDERCWQHEDE